MPKKKTTNKCDCAEVSCADDCRRKHTCHEYSCAQCRPEKETTSTHVESLTLIQQPESLEAFKERVKEPGSDGNYVKQCEVTEPIEDWEESLREAYELCISAPGKRLMFEDHLLPVVKKLLAEKGREIVDTIKKEAIEVYTRPDGTRTYKILAETLDDLSRREPSQQ